MIFKSIFKPGVLFSRAAGLVFGALLARSLLSQVNPSGTQRVQGLLRRDCKEGGGNSFIPWEALQSQIAPKEPPLTAKSAQVMNTSQGK